MSNLFIGNKTDFEKNKKKTEEIKQGWINYIEPDFVTEKSAKKKKIVQSLCLFYDTNQQVTSGSILKAEHSQKKGFNVTYLTLLLFTNFTVK